MAHQTASNPEPYTDFSHLLTLLRSISDPICSSVNSSAAVSGAALDGIRHGEWSKPSNSSIDSIATAAGATSSTLGGMMSCDSSKPANQMSNTAASSNAVASTSLNGLSSKTSIGVALGNVSTWKETNGNKSGSSILDGHRSEAANQQPSAEIQITSNNEELRSSSNHNCNHSAPICMDWGGCMDDIVLEELKRDISYIQGSLRKLTEFQRNLGKQTETLADLAMKKSPLVESILREIRTAVLQLKFQLPSESYHKFQDSEEYTGTPPPDNAGTSTPSDGLIQENYHENTSENEKKCLWCFTVFEGDVKKRVLINWWIGLGLLTTSNSTTSEKAGEQMLLALEGKKFIQQVRKKQRLVDSWTMEPSFRSFLRSEAQDRELLDLSREVLLLKSSDPIKDRNDLVDPVKTVFNLNKSCIAGIEPEMIANLESLTVLHLGISQITPPDWASVRIQNLQLILESLSKRGKLRLLSLRGIASVRVLPNSVCRLTCLAVLDLNECQALDSLPLKIGKLKCLTYLDVSGCPLLLHMPEQISKLNNLLVLKGFVIGPKSNSVLSCKLKDLGKLKKLQKLSIFVRVVVFPKAEDFAALQSIVGLVKLKILWKPATPNSGNQVVGETKTVAPSNECTKLEKLDLWCAPDDMFLQVPTNYPNLKKLYIRGVKFDPLKTSGIWRNVETLRLLYVPDLQIQNQVDDLRRTSFPRLSYLEYKHPEGADTCDYIWVKGENH